MNTLETFLEGTVRTATPLAFAAIGETVAERSGVIKIGLEGALIAGALGGFVAAGSGSVWLGFAGAGLAGLAIAAAFALFAIRMSADQIITGTAVSLLSLVLVSLPLIGRALFAQPPATYILYVLVPAIWWWMYRTHAGLGLRAIGEDPRAAVAAGINAGRIQLFAVLFGGVLGGFAGGVLVIAQAGSFAEGMSAGRGFIAVAIVVLGRWHPLGAAAAAVIFGAASALQYFFQAMG